MRVEVVYCPATGRLDAVTLDVPEGTRLREALDRSDVCVRHGLDVASLRVGIWGRVQPLDAPLREHDRVEVYRPLRVDPKEARRLRYRQRQNKPAVGG